MRKAILIIFMLAATAVTPALIKSIAQIPCTASAAPDSIFTKLYVEPTNASVSVGENVTIKIKISNVTNLYGLDIQFYWNPDILKYVNHTVKIPVEDHPDGVLHETVILTMDVVDETGGLVNQGAEPGTLYWLAAASMLPAKPFNGSGTVFEMTFNVMKEGACHLHIVSSTLSDETGKPISHMVQDGNFWSTAEPSFAPYANFTYSPEDVYVNRTVVVFNASASYDPDGGSITEYQWDFGDGTNATATEPIITHTYNQSITDEKIILRVKDDEGDWSYPVYSRIDVEIYKDVAIQHIEIPSSAKQGETVKVNITIANVGDIKARTTGAKIIVYYNVSNVNFSNVSQTLWAKGGEADTPEDLERGQKLNVTAEWDTMDVKVGIYFLKVTLDYVDHNVTNNVWMSNTTFVQLLPSIPHAIFTYYPVNPVVLETVTFNASESFDPNGNITQYIWEFGDGTNVTTPSPIIEHVYQSAAIYTVNLTVIDNEGYQNSTSISLKVSAYYPLEIDIETGKIHFPGEEVQFYILVQRQGERCNASYLTAKLYYNGTAIATLSPISLAETGIYHIRYNLDSNAKPGTYTLLVEGYLKIGNIRLKGVKMESFEISPTLNGWNALLIDLNGTIGTIRTDTGVVLLNLTEIKAALINLDDGLATIDSKIGTIMLTDLSQLNVTVTRISGDIAEVKTNLGTVSSSMGGLQSIATYGLVATCIFSLMAAVASLLLLKRKSQT